MFAGMGAGHQRLPRLERSPFLNCQMPWQMPDVARERQRIQQLSAKTELGPAGISNFSPMDGASDDQFEVAL